MLNINGQSVSLDEACVIAIRHYQQKETSAAVKLFTQVLDLDPAHPRALNALAVIESEKGDYAQAEALLDRLLSAHPAFEKGYNTRGVLRLRLKRPADAEKDFLKVVSLNPDFAEAYGNLGDLCIMRRQYSAAADYYRKVLSLMPETPRGLYCLGKTLLMLGHHDEALRTLDAALAIAPEYAEAYLAKGDSLRILGRYAEAVAAYEAALRYEPDSALCCRCLGIAYVDTRDIARAQECFLRAQQLNPGDAVTATHLGTLYFNMERRREAVKTFLQGLQAATSAEEVSELSLALGNVYVSTGQIQEAIACYRSGLARNPGNASLHSNLLMAMHYSAETSAAEILHESIAWGNNYAEKELLSCRQVGDWPLKIGFVSADFRDHSVSYFFEPLLAKLNRDRFEVYCYSGVSSPDSTTERLKSRADHWIETFPIPDDLLAERIIAEKIDILVDLSGHSNGNRLRVFERRVAPLQITWLGYPGTTGVQTIDFRISDAVADPVGVSETLHTEKLVRLPESFLCYQPPADAPQVASLPLLDNKVVTFGSFNNLAKITPRTLTVWGEILGKTPGSRLVLKSRAFADEDVVSDWHKLLEDHGMRPARVSLIPFVLSSWKHFANYAKIDIALDTFPYNGTTTTCEALWMGVPVITLSGDRHAARVGASLLSCIGLNELVTENWHDYVARAVQLAGDVEQLKLYRRTMRERMLASPLCDAAGFAVRWEDALLEMLAETGLR